MQRILAAAGQFAEIAIGHAAGILHQSHGVDHRRRQLPAGDGKVLDRSLRLGAVVGLGRDLNLAHRITFGAKIAHHQVLSPVAMHAAYADMIASNEIELQYTLSATVVGRPLFREPPSVPTSVGPHQPLAPVADRTATLRRKRLDWPWSLCDALWAVRPPSWGSLEAGVSTAAGRRGWERLG